MFSKEDKLSPKDITILLLYLYFILSLVFIGVTIYEDIKLEYWDLSFKNGQVSWYNDWIQAGYTSAVNEIIIESRKCQAFPINVWEERVNLVNIACIQDAQSQQPQATTSDSWNLEDLTDNEVAEGLQ